MSEPWLLIVDPQRIFAQVDSPWYAPEFSGIVQPITRLAQRFGRRTIITRWLPGDNRVGCWKQYFEKWEFADRDNEDPIFDLVDEVMPWVANPTVDLCSWNKWGPLLKERYQLAASQLVITGVASRSLLTTALSAADDGACVTVIRDACAGRDCEDHQAALTVLGMYEPQVRVRSCDEYLLGCDS